MVNRFTFLIVLFFLINDSFSQGRMIINDDAFVVMNGGTPATPAYIVLDNPADNALTTTGAGGNLVSENEYHVVRWNIAGNTGTYNLPYFSTTGNVKIPFILQKTTAGTGGSNIDFSSYPTNNNNISYPSTVTHMSSAQTGANNSLNAIDRFWMIKANSYATRPDFNMTFNYDPVETGGSNTIVVGDMVAQRFNSSANTWNGSISNSNLFFGVDNAPQTRVESATGPGTELWEAWTLVNNSSLLPVELLSFEVSCENDQVLVEWKTASESNSSHFDIQKSYDGLNYETIGTKEAAGNSSQLLSYSWVDVKGTPDLAYYRLRQVDNNGEEEIFQPQSIQSCGNIDDIQVIDFNNGDVEVIFNTTTENNYNITLYDLGGKKLSNPQAVMAPKGKSRVELNYHDLANSMYMLVIEGKSTVKTKKIVIQK